MHHANNMVIMQTEQLGQIETLEEKLHALEGWDQDLEHKLVEQDQVIANLVGDNLEHLQDNMYLTTHINSSLECMTLISCLSRQYSGLYLSPTLPTLLPASDIPDQCTIGGLLHNYRNPPPTNYFHIFPTIHSILQPRSLSTTPPPTI